MAFGFTSVEIAVGGGLFLLGLLLGLLAGRGGRGPRARVRALEAELAQVTERLASYRDQVEKHFVQTSDLFGDLTRQYTAVWDHLAEGARELCPDRVPGLGRGFTTSPTLLTDQAAGQREPPQPDAQESTGDTAETPAPASEDPSPPPEEKPS
jgi:uncharacterized membrane-anchored protein YhcB (DUF1043 family)